MAAGHDDIAAMTSTLRNIRLGLAQEAAATRVQRAMRAPLLRKGTIIITILITKIQAAARGLNTRTSLNNFFKACPPSGRTADLFLSRVYGGHEGGRRRGGGYVVDFIYCLRSTSLPLPFSEALARFPLEIYNPYGTVRGCDGKKKFGCPLLARRLPLASPGHVLSIDGWSRVSILDTKPRRQTPVDSYRLPP